MNSRLRGRLVNLEDWARRKQQEQEQEPPPRLWLSDEALAEAERLLGLPAGALDEQRTPRPECYVEMSGQALAEAVQILAECGALEEDVADR